MIMYKFSLLIKIFGVLSGLTFLVNGKSSHNQVIKISHDKIYSQPQYTIHILSQKANKDIPRSML